MGHTSSKPHPDINMAPKTALDYSKCTVKELKSFLSNRGIRVKAKLRKQQLVDRLTEADNNATFRFLDLPPEMRNMVYELLLVSCREEPCGPFGCHPMILATCKQVNAEASPILYSKNTASMCFSIELSISGSTQCTMPSIESNADAEDSCLHGSVFDIHPEPPYKGFLRNIESMYIQISTSIYDDTFYDEDETGPDPEEIQGWYSWLVEALRSLASFLMDSHRLKRIEIVMEADEEVSQADIEELLRPLTRLYGIAEVIINGDVSDDLSAATKASIQGPKRLLNVVKICDLLAREVSLLESLISVDLVKDDSAERGKIREMLQERTTYLRGRANEMFAAAKVPKWFGESEDDPEDEMALDVLESSIDEASFDQIRKDMEQTLDELMPSVEMLYPREASDDEFQESRNAEMAIPCYVVSREEAFKQAHQLRLEYHRQHGIETKSSDMKSAS